MLYILTSLWVLHIPNAGWNFQCFLSKKNEKWKKSIDAKLVVTSLEDISKSNFWLTPQTCAGSMIQTYSRNSNGTLKHWCGAATRMSWMAFRERLNIFFAKFCKNCHAFSCFFQFFCTKKCWKSIFRPVLAVCSTQTLVEIHNRERERERG